jgi:hypothetical protein
MVKPMPPPLHPNRRQPLTWPWVVGGAAVIWLLWRLFTGPVPTEIPPPAEVEVATDTAQDTAAPRRDTVRATPPAAARFIALVADSAQTDAIRDRQYVAEVLRRLADALVEAGELRGAEIPEVQQHADVVRQNADSVGVRIGDFANARRVHAAFTAAAAALRLLGAPDLLPLPSPAAGEQAAAGEMIDPAQPLSAQYEQLERLLARAAAALR